MENLSDSVISQLNSLLTTRGVITDIFFIVVIFFSSLAMVYLLGRMFGIINNVRGKNLIALISMISFSYVYIFILNHEIPKWIINNEFLYKIYLILPDISKLIIFVLLEVLLYILIGMKLYTRIDSRLDKDIGEDIDINKDKSDIFYQDYLKKKKHKK